MCCISDSAGCVMLHHPLYPCPHMCHLFVYLFVCLPLFLVIICCLPCLFISPSVLFPLLIGSVPTLTNCTCCIRRGLGRRLRSILLLHSSPSLHPLCIP